MKLMILRWLRVQHLLVIVVAVLALTALTKSWPSHAQEGDFLRATVPYPHAIWLDDEVKGRRGSVTFEVWVDNKKAVDTGVMRSADPPKLIKVDLTGAHYLELFVDDGGDVSTDDNADWAGAMITMRPDNTAKPEP